MDMNEAAPKDRAWDDEVGRKVMETTMAFEGEIVRVRDLLKGLADAANDDGSSALLATQQCLEAAVAMRKVIERKIRISKPETNRKTEA